MYKIVGTWYEKGGKAVKSIVLGKEKMYSKAYRKFVYIQCADTDMYFEKMPKQVDRLLIKLVDKFGTHNEWYMYR